MINDAYFYIMEGVKIMDEIKILKDMINDVSSIVVFTGAGISTPSGIPDFRSNDGIYSKDYQGLKAEDIISHSFFYKDTPLFYKFYKDKMMYLDAKPNLAHKYFASLGKRKEVTIITQNIDGLHQEAGSKRVYELHGSIHRNYCERCHHFYDASYVYNYEGVPLCEKCHGLIKPDVVLYEEPLDEDIVNRSILAIMSADMLIVVGTSLIVYPAAGFIRYFRGRYLVVINKDKTNVDNNCDLVIHDDIIKVVKKLYEEEGK